MINSKNIEKKEIIILGTSDIHGRFMPWEYTSDTRNNAGSFTQISSFIQEEKQKHENIILVDCGDAVQDNLVERFIGEKSNPMITAMNYLDYDLWVLGNHEFNFTHHDRQLLIDEFKGKTLCGNVYYEDGSQYFPATTIIEKDGIRIGMIGITTPMIAEFEKGRESLQGIQIESAILETKKAIAQLNHKVDAIIGVIHMGIENENGNPGTGVADLANVCPEIDAIIAGHMHLNVSSKEMNHVLITEPSKYGQAVSKITLTFSKDTNGYTLTDKRAQTINMQDFPSDVQLEAVLQPWHTRLRAYVNEPIGHLIGPNLVDDDEIKGISRVYTEGTGIANLFLDVCLFYSGADVVSICTDNERAQLTTGPISIKDISKNYTYTGGETTVYEMRGEDLKKYMEWSANYYNQLHPGDLTISYNPERRNSKYSTCDLFGGLTYKIDLTKEYGNRVQDMMLYNGTKITDDTILKVGMTAYRLSQLMEKGNIFEGKQFKQITDTLTIYGAEQGTTRNLAIKYIQEEFHCNYTGNYKKNWEIVGLDKESEYYHLAKELINHGEIELPTSESGYTNIRSLTIQDLLSFIDSKSK